MQKGPNKVMFSPPNILNIFETWANINYEHKSTLNTAFVFYYRLLKKTFYKKKFINQSNDKMVQHMQIRACRIFMICALIGLELQLFMTGSWGLC